ncbi:MAG TPA: TadE family protein [Candidatus Bathyarchaeia archaeon]|nr:TadE family protein [Candidatus Bathyarchaeia archaeon]
MISRANTRNRLRASSGQNIVEFALVAMIFFFVSFSIIDFSYLFFVKLTLQNAVRQAGRYAITGQSMDGHSRHDSIMQTVQRTSLGLATSANTTVCSAGGGCSSGGGPGDTVTVTVSYRYRCLTPFVAAFFTDGTYTIRESSSFKNEPFPPGQT